MSKIDDVQKDIRNLTQWVVDNAATKEDLKNLVTKEEAKGFATKDDIRELKSDIEQVLAYAESIEDDRAKNERRLTRVEKHLNLPAIES